MSKVHPLPASALTPPSAIVSNIEVQRRPPKPGDHGYIFRPKWCGFRYVKLPFDPDLVIPHKEWRSLLKLIAEYGLDEDALRIQFFKLCKCTDVSLGTTPVEDLAESQDEVWGHLFRLYVKKQARHQADRVLFEDAMRDIVEFSRKGLFDTVNMIVSLYRNSKYTDVLDTRGLYVQMFSGRDIPHFTFEILQRLHSPHATHTWDALHHLIVRYPTLAIPFVYGQRAVQRKYFGLPAWKKYLESTAQAVLPFEITPALANTLTARIIVLESMSHDTIPFTYGTKKTSVEGVVLDHAILNLHDSSILSALSAPQSMEEAPPLPVDATVPLRIVSMHQRKPSVQSVGSDVMDELPADLLDLSTGVDADLEDQSANNETGMLESKREGLDEEEKKEEQDMGGGINISAPLDPDVTTAADSKQQEAKEDEQGMVVYGGAAITTTAAGVEQAEKDAVIARLEREDKARQDKLDYLHARAFASAKMTVQQRVEARRRLVKGLPGKKRENRMLPITPAPRIPEYMRKHPPPEGFDVHQSAINIAKKVIAHTAAGMNTKNMAAADALPCLICCNPLNNKPGMASSPDAAGVKSVLSRKGLKVTFGENAPKIFAEIDNGTADENNVYMTREGKDDGSSTALNEAESPTSAAQTEESAESPLREAASPSVLRARETRKRATEAKEKVRTIFTRVQHEISTDERLQVTQSYSSDSARNDKLNILKVLAGRAEHDEATVRSLIKRNQEIAARETALEEVGRIEHRLVEKDVEDRLEELQKQVAADLEARMKRVEDQVKAPPSSMQNSSRTLNDERSSVPINVVESELSRLTREMLNGKLRRQTVDTGGSIIKTDAPLMPPKTSPFITSGFCVQCQAYASRVLADVFGYKYAACIKEHWQLPEDTISELLQAHAKTKAEFVPLLEKHRLAEKDKLPPVSMLPQDEWLELMDENCGKFFYFNVMTGEATWDAPARFQRVFDLD